MSTTKKALIFLAITFAFSWSVTIGGWAAGLHESPFAVLILTAMMAGPAVAALICAFVFEEGRRFEALGLRFKPNWWWLFAWLIPIGLAILSVALTILLSPNNTLVDIGDASIAAAAAQSPEQAEQMRVVPYLGLIIIASSVVIGALINTLVLTFTEELGWRGYLHDLWRPSGFWRASLATGVIWGVWHAPAVYLYGLNYPDNREIGLGIFVIFCVLLAPIMTLIRDRGGSTWAAGIAHGTINAVAGLTIMSLSNPAFPWTGMVGIGGFIALAIGVGATAWLIRPALAPQPAQA
jgi:membrane protease YdiL (CAAX protease family)